MTFPDGWRLRLIVGTGVDIVVRDDDPPPDPADVQLVDGLSVSSVLDDGAPWPMPPTDTASFQLYAPTADLLAGVGEQAPVWIRFWADRDLADGFPRTAEFRGRVSDAVLRSTQGGCLLDVTVTDHNTADLGEATVGDEPWPQESVRDRIDRIFDALGMTVNGDFPVGAAGYAAEVRARDVDSQPALALLNGYLDGWAVDLGPDLLEPNGYVDPNTEAVWPAGYTLARMHLRPWTWDANLVVTSWELVPVFGAYYPDTGYTGPHTEYGQMPGDLADTGDGWGVVIDTSATRAPQTVSGDYVDLASAAYTQKRGKRPNRFGVSYWTGSSESTVYRSNGELPQVTMKLSTDLVHSGHAGRVADLYLPDTGETDWYADAFTWRWGIDDRATANPVPWVGDMLTVAPIQDRHSPLGRPWYHGICTARVFTFTRAEPVATVTVRPHNRKLFILPAPDTGLTWADFPATPTWGDLNDDTWTDYRLLRSP